MKMRKRWIVLGVGAVAVVALTAGIAFAAGRGSGTPTSKSMGSVTSSSTWQGMAQTCDAMHDLPAMEAMRDQMPANLRAQCDAMHEQMGQMMQNMGSMMGGSGTTGGSGMMGNGGMADHHTASTPGK